MTDGTMTIIEEPIMMGVEAERGVHPGVVQDQEVIRAKENAEIEAMIMRGVKST